MKHRHDGVDSQVQKRNSSHTDIETPQSYAMTLTSQSHQNHDTALLNNDGHGSIRQDVVVQMPPPQKPCCGKLGYFEVCLMWLALLLFLALLAVTVAWLALSSRQKSWNSGNGSVICSSKDPYECYHHDDEGPFTCISENCALVAAHYLRNMDQSANPCEDFYQFACGKYADHNILPDSAQLISPIQDIEQRIKNWVKGMLEEEDPGDESPETFVKTLYQSCLKNPNLETMSDKTLLAFIRDLGGWPVLEGDKWVAPVDYAWERSTANVAKTHFQRIIIDGYVHRDAKNTSAMVIEIDQAELGLKSASYYEHGTDDPVIQHYMNFMRNITVALGADPQRAHSDMLQVAEFEVDLSRATDKPENRKDRFKLYNPFTLGQLKKSYTFLNIDMYLNTLFEGHYPVSDEERIIICSTDYFDKLEHVFKKYDNRVIQNYIIWRAVKPYLKFMPDQIREPADRFHEILLGLQARQERWKECVILASEMLPMITGRIFIKKHFNKNSKIETEQMTRNIQAAFMDNLREGVKLMDDGTREHAVATTEHMTRNIQAAFMDNLREGVKWMDEGTREHALAKAQNLIIKIGYPDYVNDNIEIMKKFQNVSLDPASILKNVQMLREAKVADELGSLRNPPNKDEWYASPSVVDAYYAPNSNEIVFPAGILQFPFFIEGVPRYVSYSMIGAVIGHEVTHGFDNEGRQHDKHGNLNVWWDSKTLEHFTEKGNCLAEQYGREVVPKLNLKLNGNLTLGENIADNGGVKTAYRAYKIWTKDSKTKSELKLPGLQKYTPEQLFFVGYANNWCSIMREASWPHYIDSEVHSPPEYRARIPLQNSEEFSQAFSCPPNSPMNPAHKCIVW